VKRIAVLGRGAHTLPSYRALLNRLAQNYSITVYFEVPLDPEWLKLPHDYAIRFIKRRKFPRRLQDFLFFLLLMRDHLRKPFQLIHAHSTYPTGLTAILMQKIFNLPSLVSLDGGEGVGFPEIKFGDLVSGRRATLNKWIINQASVVTALTFFQRDHVYKNLGIKREIRIITRGVDPAKFPKAEKPVGDPVVFLNVAYLSPIKDPRMLLNTFFIIQQEVKSILIQVGEDYMDGTVQQLARALNIADKVHFEGHISHERIAEYYKKSDVLLFTSRYESQGVVVSEAMATGTLVCGTHVGLMADLSGTCCITAPVQDAEGLAAAVINLLREKKRMELIRRNAWEWSDKNTLDSTVSEIRKIYDLLIK
jgi:glycosyltransferase involved in cell wall biosynthesis